MLLVNVFCNWFCSFSRRLYFKEVVSDFFPPNYPSIYMFLISPVPIHLSLSNHIIEPSNIKPLKCIFFNENQLPCCFSANQGKKKKERKTTIFPLISVLKKMEMNETYEQLRYRETCPRSWFRIRSLFEVIWGRLKTKCKLRWLVNCLQTSKHMMETELSLL